MTALAMPTGPTAGGVYLAVILLVVVVCLLVSARVWPWRRCWSCHGTGRRRSPSGRYWRDCPRCGGGGRARRLGGGQDG